MRFPNAEFRAMCARDGLTHLGHTRPRPCTPSVYHQPTTEERDRLLLMSVVCCALLAFAAVLVVHDVAVMVRWRTAEDRERD